MAMPESSNILLDTALYLHRQGFWIIPLVSKGKNPDLERWKERQHIRMSEAEITRWWTKVNPKSNIGIITGKYSRTLVLDVDSEGELNRVLQEYPTGLVAKTSRGYHLYFMYPPGSDGPIPNRDPEDGMNFRGDGGLVVAPGSVHESGFRYSWYATGTPAVLPDTLLHRVLGDTPGQRTGVQPQEEQWVSTLLRSGSPKGKRDNDGARLAGYLISKGLPLDVAKSIMRQWYDNTDHDDFPLSVLDKLIGSVSRTAARSPNLRILTPSSSAPDFTANHPVVQGFTSFVSGPELEVTWMVEDWLPDSTTGLVVAPPGTFKTWVMLAMALAVSAGLPFLNKYAVRQKQPVLLIQQEDSKAFLRQRIRTIYAQMCADNDTRVEMTTIPGTDEIDTLQVFNLPEPTLDVWVSPRMLHFSDPDSINMLADLIRERKYGLVFIDPLYMSADVDNYMADAAPKMGILKTFRDLYKTSFMLLHHTGKGKTDSMEREGGWGSQFINAWLETGWQVRPGPVPDSAKMLRHFKNVKNSNRTELLTFDIDTAPDVRRFKVDIQDSDNAVIKPGGDAVGSQNVNVLDIIANTGGSIKLQQLADILGRPASKVGQLLRKLVNEGLIKENGDESFSISPIA